MKKNVVRLLIGIVIITCAYLLMYPVAIDPGAWNPPPDPGLTGIYEPNDFLRNVDKVAIDQCPQCEDHAIDSAGNIYSGASDGRIIVFSSDFKKQRTLVNTGGRPLGMAIDFYGNIFVADAYKGLLWISPGGVMKVLTDSYNDRRFVFLDDLAIAPDSSILFTEASKKFPLEHDVLDIIEHRPNGALFRYDLRSNTTELLIDSLYFGNGIAISPDGSYLLVNNMNKYQVLKYHLAGEKKGQQEVFLDNLPAFPDGVNLGPDGTVWVSLPVQRIDILDRMLPYPFLRKVMMRLPQPKGEKPYGFILGFNGAGELKYNFQGPEGTYTGITNVVPFRDVLYLGSIRESSIGLLKLSK